MPELVTTLTAIAKKQDSLSVGNVIGANIIDLTLILPLCALISGGTLAVSAQSLAVDFPACMVTLLVGLLPLLLRQKGARVQGIAMLALYAGYLTLGDLTGPAGYRAMGRELSSKAMQRRKMPWKR